jgi:hypothetical protein
MKPWLQINSYGLPISVNRFFLFKSLVMKNIFFLLLAAGLTIASCSKSPISANDPTTASTTSLQARRGADDPPAPIPAGLPAVVVSSFNSRYPTAARVEWQAEDGNTWKAKFFIGTQRKRALFAADGTFIWERND